jgi:hypothetical protein
VRDLLFNSEFGREVMFHVYRVDKKEFVPGIMMSLNSSWPYRIGPASITRTVSAAH